VVASLLDNPPERIVYVSCDPATLARDIRSLSPAFELAALRAFDLFPQTAHVETVATLTRRTA
jgi:23S rRNA (uracil1939-C5)-methyltransferase